MLPRVTMAGQRRDEAEQRPRGRGQTPSVLPITVIPEKLEDLRRGRPLPLMLRGAVWCAGIIWPAYALEMGLVAALRHHSTTAFSDALRIGLYGLPVAAVIGVAYGAILAALNRFISGRGAAVAVLALAALIQVAMRQAGKDILEMPLLPVGLGSLALVAVSWFELARSRVPARS
jgi:hypothetical protein